MNAHELAGLLKGKKTGTGTGYSARCPAHDDKTPSLSIADGEKGVVFRCHAGCDQQAVADAIKALGAELGTKKTPLNLAEFAATKKLPVEFLRENGVDDRQHNGNTLLSFEYRTMDGKPFRTKYRTSWEANGKTPRFFYSGGNGSLPYGLWRMYTMLAEDGRVILCEGESDTLTMWHHGFTALGIAGAEGWKEDFADYLPEHGRIFVCIDKDEAGEKFAAKFRNSRLWPRIHYLRMPDAKDPSALHIKDPAKFADILEGLIASATLASDEPEAKAEGEGASIEPVTLDFLLSLNLPPPKQMIGNLVCEGTLGVISAQKGVGKTFFSLGLALAAAGGKEFLGHAVETPIDVLYVDGEMSAYDMGRRCTEMGNGMGLTPADFKRLHILNPDMPGGIMPKLNTPEARAFMDAYLRANPKVRLVIFDNFACLVRKDGQDTYGATAWTDVNDLLMGCRRLNVAALVVAHHGKDSDRGARGASEATDIVDLSISLTTGEMSETHTNVSVKYDKARHLTPAEKQSFVASLGKDPNGPGLLWTRSGQPPLRERIVELLLAKMPPGDVAKELGCNRPYVYQIKRDMDTDKADAKRVEKTYKPHGFGGRA